MAITFIYAVKATGDKSLNYDLENKEAVIIGKDGGQASLSYDMRDKRGNIYKLSSEYLNKMKKYIRKESDGRIVFQTLSTTLNCSGNYQEWKTVRNQMNPSRGNKGNLQYCIVQNFGMDLDPAVANEIGVQFAREYLADYQCVVSTHINTGYVHNHIEFNATSFVTGRKFNDELKTVAEIRKISDRLCQEHELEILKDTAEFRYVLYKDSSGKIKSYEPTARKDKKKEGEYYNKNDYRNTQQYSESVKYKDIHIVTLQHDIDMFLPLVGSYEELLGQLRAIGYEIKDKTKHGWRKHISFKYPGWGAYTRDSSLKEGYDRENIVKFISRNNFSESELRNFILEDMGRTMKQLNVPLTDIRGTEKTHCGKSEREQYLLDRINQNLQSVKFLNRKGIKNFDQLEEGVKNLYMKKNQCCEQLLFIKKHLVHIHSLLGLANEYRSNQIFQGNAIENMIYKLDLQDAEKQEQLQAKYDEFYKRFSKLQEAVGLLEKGISEYDNCVACIRNIDREEGKYKHRIDSYRRNCKESSNNRVLE